VHVKHNKQLVIYLSMAFGNPYGDEWNGDIAVGYTAKLYQKGIRIFAMSDTIGSSNQKNITDLFGKSNSRFRRCRNWSTFAFNPRNKIRKNCCHIRSWLSEDLMQPFMALVAARWLKKNLTGNLATESLIDYLDELKVDINFNRTALNEAYNHASLVFA
jgi:hydroxymethylglutaryl-CoA lyase